MRYKGWVLHLGVWIVFGIATGRDVLGDESIGRVFMTSEERQILDRLRLQQDPPPRVVGSSPAKTEVQQPDAKRHPTGYIVSAKGRPYQWIDGDFKEVQPHELDVRQLQGHVSITSQPVRPGGKNGEQTQEIREDERRLGEPASESGLDDDVQR